MPSILGRIFSFSFRTERLIMNIIGLINSTFDWNPLKWTNELEQIQNISLAYSTLILETIGEDTIKNVLSWIVITRIVIAHVYTFSYLMNIYPILTWSRPNLLLPWLILSFFKNVVLEVIVLAVCLLLWYDKRFSLAIFLEFVVVKVVPLILATYNWYSNSCLFLELRHKQKMLELKSSLLRDDVHYLNNRLYTKIPYSKYKSRSLTTLLSYESYDTFDTHDIFSRITDDSNLNPGQKAMKILGLSQQDVMEARIRKKESAIHKRLTEIEDDLLNINKAMDRKIFLFDEEFEAQLRSLPKIVDEDDEEEDIIEEQIVVEKAPSLSEDPPENQPEEPKTDDSQETPVTEPPSKRTREESNASKITETEQNEQFSSNSKDNTSKKEEDSGNSDEMELKEKEEENREECTKGGSFNCDCIMDDKIFKDIQEHCCFPDNMTLMTSTPKEDLDDDETESDFELDMNDQIEHSCFYDCNIVHEDPYCETDCEISVPSKALNNDAEVFQSNENQNSTPNTRESLNPEKFENDNDQVADQLEGLLKNVKQDVTLDTELEQRVNVVNRMENVQRAGLEILENTYLGKLEGKLKTEGNQLENLLGNVKQDTFLNKESRQEPRIVDKIENLLENDVKTLENKYLGKLKTEGNQLENLLKNIKQNPSLDNKFKQESPIVNKMENLQKAGFETLESPYLGRLKTEGNHLKNLFKNIKQSPSLDSKSKQETPIVIKMENLQKTDFETLDNPYLGKLKTEENQLKNLFKNIKQSPSLDNKFKQESPIINKMENLQKAGFETLENSYLGKLNTDGNHFENLLKNIKQNPHLDNKSKQEAPVVNKMENVPKTEYKILENIKEDPYLKRLVTEVKLKKEITVADQIADSLRNIKQDLSLNDKSKQEIQVEDKLEDPATNERKSKEKIGNELKTVLDDSCTKTVVVDENWKQTVRRVTHEIDNLLQNYEKQKSSFVTEEKSMKQIVDQIESNQCVQNRNVSIDTQNLSKIVGDTVAKPIQNFGILTIDVEDGKVKLKTENEMLKTMVPLKTAVLADINSTQKNGSHKPEVEGKKSKVNVPEYSFGDTTLQCLLQQFENWKPFAHQANAQTPLKRGVEINQSDVQNVRNISTQTKGYEKTDRSKVTASPRKNHRPEIQVSQKTQVYEQTQENIPLKSSQSPKTASAISTKETNSVSSSRTSHSIVANSYRGKTYPKHKLWRKQGHSTSFETQEPVRHHEERKKQPKSPSNKNVCECKMRELEAKCSPSTESRLEKKEEPRRTRVNTFGTATLSQVTRASEFAVTYRKKPPIYPRKSKIEESPSWRNSSGTKHVQKSKTKASKDDRETRVLKVFNEDTLWRYKRELEAKRKFPFGRNSVDVAEESKPKTRPRKKICQDAKQIPEEHVDKENLDTSSSPATSRSINEDDKSSRGSDGGHVCSKLSKMSKVTNRVLDRLLSVQKQGQKRLATEMDNRKQLTKYTKPKKMIDEEVVGASSSKKLEGVQRGRELERSPGKEDIRSQLVHASGSSRRQLSRVENNQEDKKSKKQEDRSLKTIKPSVNQDLASKWSSSTVDQTEEAPPPEIDNKLRVKDQLKTISSLEEVPEVSNLQEETEPESNTVVETSEDGVDRTRRRSTNYSDFSRSIDVSHMGHGVVLTNTNAPRSKSPRLRDIVGENTSRLLHEAFSYQSVDSFFDFTEDNLTLNDIMNERHPNTLDDDFVCQSSNDAIDVFSDELPIAPQDAGNLAEAIPMVLQEVQNLDQGEENCNLIIAIDESLATLQGVNFVEFHLGNVLSTVGETLRNLNVREFGLEDIEESPQEISSENGEEEVEEGVEEEDQTLRFIKEDVFTDIKFPVVINWSDSVVARDEDPEKLSSTIDEEPTIKPVDLANLIDEDPTNKPVDLANLIDEDVKQKTTLGDVGMKNMEQSVFYGKFSSEPEASTADGNVGSRKFFFGDSSSGSCRKVSSEDILDSGRWKSFESDEKMNGFDIEEIDSNIAEEIMFDSEEAVGSQIEDESDKFEEFEETIVEIVRFEKSKETDGNVRLNNFEEEEKMAEEKFKLRIEEDTRLMDFWTKEALKMEEIEEVDRNIRSKDSELRKEENLGRNIEDDTQKIEKEETISTKQSLKLNIEEGNKFFFEIEKEETVLAEQSLRMKEIEGMGKNVVQNDTKETIPLEESMELEEIEEIIYDRRLMISDTENEDAKQMSDSKIVENPTDIVENRELVEHKSNEQVSLLIICIFWMTVFFFFVRNCYQNLCSFKYISRSMLRPFDVHSAPVSTVKILEQMEKQENDLIKKTTEEYLRSARTSSNFTMDQMSSGIIEIREDSEEMERDEEDVRTIEIDSFASFVEDQSRSNVSPSIYEDVEEFDKKVFVTENQRLGEEEIKTLRFEDDDSSSTKSLLEHDDGKELFNDSPSSRLLAQMKIDKEIEEYVGETRIEERTIDEEKNKEDRVFLKDQTTVEDKNKEDRVFLKDQTTVEDKNKEDRVFLKDQTTTEETNKQNRILPKDETISKAKIEEAEDSSEMKKTLSSNLKLMDSFDSTFSQISEGSKYTISDLNGSSMDEFEET